ncbi:hypothetical protein BvRS1_55530 [Burkholderia vietnamiensis]|jgi:hypothetical protein|nr:hypothetical protein BvRS1_55530 [Burkholderia vietnamiensis]
MVSPNIERTGVRGRFGARGVRRSKPEQLWLRYVPRRLVSMAGQRKNTGIPNLSPV